MYSVKMQLSEAGFSIKTIAENTIEVYLNDRKVSKLEIRLSIRDFNTSLLSFHDTDSGVVVMN